MGVQPGQDSFENVEFAFTSGLQEEVDGRQAIKLLTARNVVWTKQRQLRCRNGNSAIAGGGGLLIDTMAGDDVTGDLVCLANPASGTIYPQPYYYRTQTGASHATWQALPPASAQVGTTTAAQLSNYAPACLVTRRNTAIAGDGQLTPGTADVAYCNGVLVYAYALNGNVHVYAEDAVTGAVLLSDAANGVDTGQAIRIVVVGTTVSVLYLQAGVNLRRAAIDTTAATPAVALSTLTVLNAPDLNVLDADVNSAATGIAIAYYSGNNINVSTFNTSFVEQLRAQYTTATTNHYCVAIRYSSDGSYIYVANGENNAGSYQVRTTRFSSGSLTQQFTAQTASMPASGTHGITNITVAELSNIYDYAVICGFTENITGLATDMIRSRRVTAAGSITPDANTCYTFTLTSRAFVRDGQVLAIGCNQSSQTYHVISIAPPNTGTSINAAIPIATFAPRTASRTNVTASQLQDLIRTIGSLCNVTANGNVLYTLTAVTLSGQTHPPSVVQLATLDFTWGRAPFSRALGQWVEPNAQMRRVTARGVTEVCPVGKPYLVDGSGGLNPTAGGSIDLGTHTYQVCYGLVLDDGTIVRGMFSQTYQVTTTTGNQTVKIAIAGPGPSYCGGYTNESAINGSYYLIREIYRTKANDSVLYLLNSTKVTNTQAVTETFTDTTADNGLDITQLAYWNGGGFANVCPPSCAWAVRSGDRVWCGGGDDGVTIYYSDLMNDTSDTPAFHDENTVAIDDGGVSTAFAVLDDKKVVFKNRIIYYFLGEPGNSAGVGGTLSDPAAIPTGGIGCTGGQKSVAVIPDGVLFQSARGIELLTRNNEVVWIGAPVQDEMAGATVAAVVVRPDVHQVVFFVNNGSGDTCLVYDYVIHEWSTWTLNARAACSWQSKLTWSPGSAFTLQETPGVYLDNGSFITITVQTGWKHFTGVVGYQRIRSVQLNGEWQGACGIQLDWYVDYAQSASTSVSWTDPQVQQAAGFITGGVVELNAQGVVQKCAAASFKWTTLSPSVPDGNREVYFNAISVRMRGKTRQHPLPMNNRR